MTREKLIPMAEVVAAIRRIDRLGSAADKEALSAALKLPYQYFRERQEREGKARSREIIAAIGAKFKRRSPRKP